jgi:hypothetical protein
VTASTTLAELFRVNFHGELRTVIESWRPYLLGDDDSVDVLQLSHFEFDKKRIYSDLIDLAAIGALAVPLSQLAYYLSEHSNLSNSYATLYRQLKLYRSEESQK